ncbi:hypothetical protein HCMG_01012 [Helicobacter canadensis MIT 98-5491]|nr:hypothetical protein HCMG_01012 [Helicobacter canadensis MIT 98-5491]
MCLSNNQKALIFFNRLDFMILKRGFHRISLIILKDDFL